MKHVYNTPYTKKLNWTEVELASHQYYNRHTVLDHIKLWCDRYDSNTEYSYLISINTITWWFENKDIALIFKIKWDGYDI